VYRLKHNSKEWEMAQQQSSSACAWAPPRLQFLPISLDEDLEQQRSRSSGSRSGESDFDDDATPVVNEQAAWNHAQRLPFVHYDASVAASCVLLLGGCMFPCALLS
jgi:hypothetical protein